MKPNDFFLGISAFFTVLIPGFLVTAIGVFIFGQYTLETSINTLAWTMLGITSYIVGHILFALGSTWDRLDQRYPKKGNEPLLDEIKTLKKSLDIEEENKNINKYQWCRSVLLSQSQACFMDVARKEADSKLFRALIIPLMIFSIYWLLHDGCIVSMLSALLSLVAYFRYREQRFKACRMAYIHVLTLHSIGKLGIQVPQNTL